MNREERREKKEEGKMEKGGGRRYMKVLSRLLINRLLLAYLLPFTFYLLIACDNPWATSVLPPRDQEGALVSKPVVIGLPDPESITIGEVELLSSTNQIIEYAISNTDDADPDTLLWQTLTTFHELTSGTAYFVYARSRQNPNYNAGTPSISDLIRFYTVFFFAPDAERGTPPLPKTVLEETIITLPDWGHEDDRLWKAGSAFGSWNEKEDGSGIDYIPGYQYRVTHDQEMYVKWLPAQTYEIDFSTWPVQTPGTINYSGLIISQTGQTGEYSYPFTATMSISSELFALADSVQWYVQGVSGISEIGTGQSIELDARDVLYNIPGEQRITLRVITGGVPYSYIISFEVRP